MNYISELINSLARSDLGKAAIKHAPTICLFAGGAGLAGTIIATAHATKKSISKIEEEKQRLNKTTLTTEEIFKLCWRDWLTSAGFAVGSLVAFVSAYRIADNRCAVLATAVSGYELKLASLEREMMTTLGEKKAEEIKTEVAKDIIAEKKIGTDESKAKLRADPETRREGQYWCFDPITEQEFLTNYDKLQLAIERCDRCLDPDYKNWDEDSEVELAYFLELAGGKYTSAASKFVWKSSKCTETRITITTCKNEHDEPIYLLEYNNKPEWRA